MKLYHFSEEPGVTCFEPRPVATPAERRPGEEWLNGPLVWAIEEAFQPLYLFPRDCPRILYWPVESTSPADRERLWGKRTCRFVAAIEWAWLERVQHAALFRYELPAGPFEPLGDAGMAVARTAVRPVAVEPIPSLPAALCDAGVELRVLANLHSLLALAQSSLHVSAIRMRNALPPSSAGRP